MNAFLSVQDLSVSFGKLRVINNVSFELNRGESLAIIGPNGSGKTVLLKTLLGLTEHAGSFFWSPDARLGYVPQKIDADRHLPINLQNLLEAKASIQHLKRADILSTVKTVGLPQETLRTPIGHLSGGQFQKALIAYALLGNPNVILFDEPTASLDELSEEHIYELLNELRRERGLTVILVSHDLSIVPEMADKILCLNKSTVCFGPPEEALTEEVFAKLYSEPHKVFHHPSEHHHRHHA